MELNITLAQEELDSIRLIVQKKLVAQKSMDRMDFPKEMEANLISAYYKAAGENLAEANFAEKNWWRLVTKKYNLGDTSLDIETGILTNVEKE